MSFLSAIRVALGALLVHKGRSFLTSLGIVIGISAVIAMVSAGDGARFLLEDRLNSLGNNLILIRPGSRTAQGMVADFEPITGEDVRAVRQRLGHELVAVAPTQVTQRLLTTHTAHHGTSIVGCTHDLELARGWKMQAGRFISAEDDKKMASVCIIGVTVQKKLFSHQSNVLGQSVRVDRLNLRIVGVMAPKGRSPTGADQDDQVFMPLTTLQRKLAGEERLTLIITGTRNEGEIEKAKADISRVLRERHHLKPGHETFDVNSVYEIADLAVLVTTVLQSLVAIVASISLVVGGIGIMNIMLVSVTERTREIGIRMAIGATPANVLTQFLIEAIVLSLTGGLIGVALGLGAAIGLARLTGWPIVISPIAVLVAGGVSGGVGVFFGYYPAWKASRLDPIQALRHE
ncbi:MAG TPA: ABC transporter permease [Gemmataceae bacterium]|nr:ABC transporter permease [Gemmataceae bacterium]